MAAVVAEVAPPPPLGVAEVPPLGVAEVAVVVAEALLLRAPTPLPRRQVAPCSLGRTIEPRVPRVALQVTTPPQAVHRVVERGEEGPTTHI